MPRETIIHRVRAALGRTSDQPAPPAPPVWSNPSRLFEHEKVGMFQQALEAAGGIVSVVQGPEMAHGVVMSIVAGHTAVASQSSVLRELGIPGMEGVASGFASEAAMRAACRDAEMGITSADFAIAHTGTLVLMSSSEEARMISLLPPMHIAVVPRSRIVSNLSEFFERVPDPAALTSALVFLTGPSRTADIEQVLVRGVHGPRYLHVILF